MKNTWRMYLDAKPPKWTSSKLAVSSVEFTSPKADSHHRGGPAQPIQPHERSQ